MLIGIAGSSYGLTAERPGISDYAEETRVVQFIKDEKKDAMIVATESFVEYVGVQEPELQVLYGKDIYTPNMDLGIVDTYPMEVVHLYELMKQPQGSMGMISRMAALCECDVIVTEYFENAPDKAGAYYKKAVTEKYLVYIR